MDKACNFNIVKFRRSSKNYSKSSEDFTTSDFNQFIQNIIIRLLPSLFLNDIIQWFTRLEGALIEAPPVGLALDAVGFHDVPMKDWEISADRGVYKFWRFNQLQLNTASVTIRLWRITFDIIATELFNEKAARNKFKLPLSGVTSNANGLVRMQTTRKCIVTAIMHRLHKAVADSACYRKFINYPLLDKFCQARAEAYLL